MFPEDRDHGQHAFIQSPSLYTSEVELQRNECQAEDSYVTGGLPCQEQLAPLPGPFPTALGQVLHRCPSLRAEKLEACGDWDACRPSLVSPPVTADDTVQAALS